MYNYYNYGYDYNAAQVATGVVGVALGVLIFIWIIGIAISVFTIICNWKVFTKANKPGWASIVPIYNFIVLLEIVELPMWYIALLLVPFANIYAVIKIYIELAKKFGKSSAFGVGLILLNPIFMAILAFSKECVFIGNTTVTNNNVMQSQQPVEQHSVQQPLEQSVRPSFCPGCGSPVAENSKFCIYCGRHYRIYLLKIIELIYYFFSIFVIIIMVGIYEYIWNNL